MLQRQWKGIQSLTRQPIVHLIALAAVVCALYAPSTQVGFFNDDPTGHFSWMEHRSLLRLFTSASGYPFYRPLTFVLWKALYALLGRYEPLGFHLLNVFFHALNCALVWMLGYALTREKSYALLAGLLFACFPFSYEAVGYAGALFHPLVTFLILVTLLLYHESKQRNSTVLFGSAHLILVLAVFTHENGAIAPLLILAWEALAWGGGQPFHRRAWTFLLESVLFFGLWLIMPRSPLDDSLLQPLSSMWASALHFFQAIVHPVAPLAVSLAARWGMGREVALLAVGLVGLGAVYLLAHLSRLRDLFVLTLVLALLTALPAVLFLEGAYVSGSPRLYYLTAVGTSLLWGTAGLGMVRLVQNRSRWLRYGTYLVLAVLVLALLRFDVDFVLCRQGFYLRVTELMHMISDAATAAPPDKELVYINLPLYFSSAGEEQETCPNPFPYGPSGALAFPQYASVSDFITVHGGPKRPAVGVTAAAFAPGWETYGQEVSLEQVRRFLSEDYVYLCDLASWRLFPLSGHWETGREPEGMSAGWVTFGEGIALADYEVGDEDGTLQVTLDWRCLQAPLQPYTVFVHLYAPEGGPPVAQDDGPPVHNYVPTNFWQVGDRIRDEKSVLIPAGWPAGEYTLAVGLYDPLTGERLPAVGYDGQRYFNDAVPLYQLALP